MAKTRWISISKTAGKLAIMALAFWWISRKISWAETWLILKSSNWIFVLIALIIFNASKILSAFRLQRFWKSIGLNLEPIINLKLYYIGMFYNLFLPGGIGGDGYKIWYLKREAGTDVKSLSIAVIVDRISGIIPLIFLCVILMWFIEMPEFIPNWLLLAISLGFIPGYLLAYWLLGKVHKGVQNVYHRSNIDGLGVQLLQVLSVIFILLSIHESEFPILIFLFLISSVVAVLPLTIGGVGAREWVMVNGTALFALKAEPAVALSLIFFAITAISSLAGAFLSLKNSKSQ